ncbi:universal stress protein [Rhizobium paknamense]|uniref:Nucleotide-binding universal stress UspA family protein n=1 Tax=Rhizobium paknamense TaxID=1206817 RepID=A0ABU0I7Y8_9HYPH|nr:universal stress protein [Rhizobium paknamense]MDQ0454348.1 nucleotide-binding universal stress UspA family protein [Rhizobium paknamense]
MFRKIIVPVDIGQMEKGRKSLTQALSLLDAGGEVVLLTVVEKIPAYLTIEIPYELNEEAIAQARKALAGLAEQATVPVKQELRLGAPAHEILESARDHQADLIIIASHVPDFSNYLIGATADRVVRHAQCSVLVSR